MYAKEFRGEPTSSNFELVEEAIEPLKEGEILTSAQYLSVDPYMRPYMLRYKAPCLMIGGQMAKIVESKNAAFPVDSIIFGQFGWRDYTVLNPSEVQKNSFIDCYILPKYDDLPSSLGMN